MKFEIESLSQGQADCFLILLENDLGDECNILIDGNCEGKNNQSFHVLVERIAKLKKLDFIVVTHIDNDHIGGILSLFGRDKDSIPHIEEQLKECIIVYNSIVEGLISYSQAERFEELLHERRIVNSFSHRYKNPNKMLYYLSIQKRKILKLNERKKNNVYITFLNPDENGVKNVINDYKKYKLNGKNANGKLINENSIAFLIEFQGKKVLFTGDAYFESIKKAIDKLNEEAIPSPIKKIDLIKIPHHGAVEYNKELACTSKNMKCSKFIVTGRREWDEKHPGKDIIDDLFRELSGDFEIYTEVDLAIINEKYKPLQRDFKKGIDIL